MMQVQLNSIRGASNCRWLPLCKLGLNDPPTGVGGIPVGGVCQQLKKGQTATSRANAPADSVKDHSTSGLSRLKTLRQITIPLFHPSCWYSGKRFPTASIRLIQPKIVPHAIPLRTKFTVTPASNTKSCCKSGRLCRADISIRIYAPIGNARS